AIAAVPQLYREVGRISGDAVEWTNSLTPERIRELAGKLEAWLTERGVPVDFSAGEEGQAQGLGFSVNLEESLRQAAEKLSQLFRENLGNILTVSRNIITSVLAGVFTTFFMLMVAAFFSIDFQRVRSYCGTLIPPEHADDARVLVKRIEQSLAGVVRGQVTICVVNGVLTFVGLVIFGVKFAFLLATVATVFSLIPIFGTILSSIPIVLIGLSQSWKTGLAMLLWIVGIHALEAYFLNPKIMGSAARIHPVVVVFALIAGEHTFGLVGALFAVPMAALVVACFDFARQKAQPEQVAGPATSAPGLSPAAPPPAP
ncbi:MAG TPA: AI-2E family transporter, partial [Myxococcaceae bacterium]|nr:AI-2E family transporter [Myxococcaceae bacterium]